MKSLLKKTAKKGIHAIGNLLGAQLLFRQIILTKMSLKLQFNLRKNVSFNGAELHALLVFRQIKYLTNKLQKDIGSHILEIGGYPHPGLALVFLLAGAKKYYLNNILPVDNRLPLAYAQNIYALLELSLSNKCELFDVVELIENSQSVRIKPHLIEIIHSRDASKLDFPDEMFDFIFSIAVLEHVKETAPALQNIYRMLKKGAWSFHSIDMRDHSNFNAPLNFLKYSDEEFNRRQPYNNRMRRSEHLKEFESAGFIVDSEDYFTPLPTLPNGETDCFNMLCNPIDKVMVNDINKVNIWVNEQTRYLFHPKFHTLSLTDLSITGINICVRKPI